MALLLGTEIRRLSGGVAINGLLTGATTVLPAFSKNVVITRVVLRVFASSGVTVPPTAKVEKNPAAGDIFNAELMNGVTALNDVWVFNSEAKNNVLLAGTPLDVNITVAGTGSTLSLAAEVFGYILY